jgi:hypothetical protein
MLCLPAGCLTWLNPVAPLTPEKAALCLEIPKPCRNHVHIFFIHGLDPLDFANLTGVCDHLHKLGFIKTHFGQLYHIWKFKSELRKVHEQDPEARFALIGFSFGANMVRDLANALKDEDVPIDLLFYLGGNTLENTTPNRPPHVLRIVNVLAHGWIWHGATLDGAENVEYSDCWHFGSPTHLHTLDVLAQELAAIAQRIPIVEHPAVPKQFPGVQPPPKPRPLKKQPQGQPLPTPRPLNKQPANQELPAPRPANSNNPQPVGERAKRDDWDFLKPNGTPGGAATGLPGHLAEEAPAATIKVP